MLADDRVKSLGTVQTGFASALLNLDHPVPADVIGPKPGKKAVKRFGVYRNNVLSGLIEAMAGVYPVVRDLVGEEFFNATCSLYIRQHPPRSKLLITYGDAFADFLASFPPAAELPYLADVARLERAWLDAYHAADAAPFDPTALQSIPPERLGELTFSFHPSARLLRSDHPVFSIWSAHSEHGDKADLGSVDHSAQSVLITRPQWQVSLTMLPDGADVFFKALMTGASLADAAEKATNAKDDFDFGQHFTGLLQTGALISADLPHPAEATEQKPGT
nr:DNA-binding domain-containing protein [uncultured Cohaesibacter sp.]